MIDNNQASSKAPSKLMSAEDAVRVISELKKLDIKVILDGGWGIDALLEEETREHSDLDFLVEKKDIEKLSEYLSNNNYEQTDNFNKWWHKSFENEKLVIDIHVIEIDEVGKAIYGPRIRDDFPFPGVFPAYALNGLGKINGYEVNCLTPEYRVLCQTRVLLNLMPDNYKHKPDKKDYRDIEKLCKKFSITMPEELLPLGN